MSARALFSTVQCRIVWGVVFLLAGNATLSLAETGQSLPTQRLVPGETVVRSLSEPERHVFELVLPIGGPYVAVVEQYDVDVRLSWIVSGREAKTVDSPNSGLGPEIAVLRASPLDRYKIMIDTKEIHDPGARYELRIQPLEEETGPGRLWVAAALEMTEAGIWGAKDDAEARQKAVVTYQQAADLWQEVGEVRFRATALHATAILSSRLGEMERALDFYDQAVGLWRRLDEKELESAALNNLGLVYLDLGELQAAMPALERSIRLSQELGDTLAEAITRSNQCMNLLATGQIREALPCYEQVLALHRSIGETDHHARTLLNLGWIQGTLGEPQRALENLDAGLAILRSLEERFGEAQALNNIGYIYESLGEPQAALERYIQALGILRAHGDRWWTARLLNNIGYVYWRVGDQERAQTFFEEALPLRREVQDRRGEALTLLNLGQLELNLGKVQSAIGTFQQALLLIRETSFRQKEGAALALMGKANAVLGDHDQAGHLFEQALQVIRDVGDRGAEAQVLVDLARLQLDLAEPRRALVPLERALQIQRAVRLPHGEIQTLYELARTFRQLGQANQAQSYLKQALDLIESQRVGISSPVLRAAFLATRQEAYALRIELLMDRHRAAPRSGFDRQAFVASEKSRARFLLDLLNETGADLYRDAEPELRERRQQLKRRLNAKAAYQHKILTREHTEEEAADAHLAFVEALTELETLEAQLGQPLVVPANQHFVSPEEVQAWLDEETVLLEYSLGKERSYLWVIGQTMFSSFELPPRIELEQLAREAYDELSAVDLGRPRQAPQAGALAEAVLGPVAGWLEGQRLIIVADGALHYLPFGALPIPSDSASGSGEPLVSRHEIVSLPSASTLAIQRRIFAARTRARKTLAILADPVFQSSDPRLGRSVQMASHSKPTSLERSGRPSMPLGRLPATRTEANSILTHVPHEKALIALGFDANKSLIFDGRLRDYQIVHLATHGMIDAERPELSGLILSQLDTSGRPRDGVLRLHDLYDLDLNADLVVLSGCQTALGAEMRGEGLVGLTSGFMHSGARRVLASLWRVQDDVTAELMRYFYRGILVEGLSPAAALRQAQLSIRAQKQWQGPYYWAAFVLQGEWNSRPLELF